MKILITGTSGHLGEAIARTLIKLKIDYVGVDILPSDFTTRIGSIADRNFVKESMRDVDSVLHTATLHKPHVATHSIQDFIDTNITGTTNLLEEAVRQNVGSFIFTSTTSTFGDALTPSTGSPATWITENVRPIPKNIYGVTKIAAEDICGLFHRKYNLPCLILRTSRFFQEDDDKESMRTNYDNLNLKANELLYRRADVEDIVEAHLLAVRKAAEIGFDRYIISSTTPFVNSHLVELNTDAPNVVKQIFPEYEEIYQSQNWKMFPTIDRVYVNEKARTELGWQPKYTFENILNRLKNNQDIRSDLTLAIGAKGYHSVKFAKGPYPIE